LTIVAICSASSPASRCRRDGRSGVGVAADPGACHGVGEVQHVRKPRQQEDRRQREGDDKGCGIRQLFAFGLHCARGGDGGADAADRHRGGQQGAKFVVETEPSAEPPGEPEHDGDQQQRLDDGGTCGGDEHLEVDRCAEEDKAGLDEELGAEAVR